MAGNGTSLTPDYTRNPAGLLVPQSVKQKPWPRIVIGMPVERTISQHAFFGFLRIFQRGYPFIKVAYTRADIARNTFASQLLETDFTHLLMLDTDHVHPSDIVERLGRWVKEDPTRWVVSGLYFRRGPPFDPLIYIERDGDLKPLAQWEEGLIQVDAVGTGAILIARQVFETIPGPPWFYYEYNNVHEDRWTTEDIVFCWLCREHGIDIWCDTTTVSPHLISTSIDESAFKQYMAEHPLKTMEV